MNINQLDLADALVLTTNDIKIICCAGCCVIDKMLHCGKERGSSINTFRLSTGLRNQWEQSREGSNPFSRTKKSRLGKKPYPSSKLHGIGSCTRCCTRCNNCINVKGGSAYLLGFSQCEVLRSWRSNP